jgi:hypothetical protein
LRARIAKRLAPGQELAADIGDLGKAERPQGKIDEVDAEIHHAPAAG